MQAGTFGGGKCFRIKWGERGREREREREREGGEEQNNVTNKVNM